MSVIQVAFTIATLACIPRRFRATGPQNVARLRARAPAPANGYLAVGANFKHYKKNHNLRVRALPYGFIIAEVAVGTVDTRTLLSCILRHHSPDTIRSAISTLDASISRVRGRYHDLLYFGTWLLALRLTFLYSFKFI